MSTLTTLRSALRNDLGDTGSVTWTDALLERAIGKAVGDLNQFAPVLASTTINGVASQRRYDLSATTGLLWVEGIEYPIDQEPRAWLPYQEDERGKVYLIGSLPAAGTSNIKLWYAKSHTVDASGSTVPADLEELLLTGGYAYAMQQRASSTIASINPSQWSPRQARDLAVTRLTEFRAGLEHLRKTRAGRLWTPTWGGTPTDWSTV